MDSQCTHVFKSVIMTTDILLKWTPPLILTRPISSAYSDWFCDWPILIKVITSTKYAPADKHTQPMAFEWSQHINSGTLSNYLHPGDVKKVHSIFVAFSPHVADVLAFWESFALSMTSFESQWEFNNCWYWWHLEIIRRYILLSRLIPGMSHQFNTSRAIDIVYYSRSSKNINKFSLG